MAHDVFAPDLVRRYTCIGHLCTEPLSVSRPVHLDTRARWIRVATRGVHVLRDVRIPTRVYTSRVPGTRQLHAGVFAYLNPVCTANQNADVALLSSSVRRTVSISFISNCVRIALTISWCNDSFNTSLNFLMSASACCIADSNE